MPTNRRQKTKQSQSETQDIDEVLMLSQSSDDAGVMASAIQQMQVTRDKKRKEKETKFLRALQKQLDSAIGPGATECSDNLQEIGAIFEQFVMEYAALEDKIRLIKEELTEECEKLRDCMTRGHQTTVHREEWREKSHVKGLSLMRTACEDFRQIIDEFGATV